MNLAQSFGICVLILSILSVLTGAKEWASILLYTVGMGLLVTGAILT